MIDYTKAAKILELIRSGHLTEATVLYRTGDTSVLMTQLRTLGLTIAESDEFFVARHKIKRGI
jgi:hypothetical protein